VAVAANLRLVLVRFGAAFKPVIHHGNAGIKSPNLVMFVDRLR
jgi:hypothetical protein